jgi:Uma2 family endonuclease
MVTTGARIKFTYEDYYNAPEDKRYELHDGDLVVIPSPNELHQRVLGNILFDIALFVRERDPGRVYPAPFDVVFTNHDVVQPDVIFVSNDRIDIITPDNIQGAPDLVIEVLSPSTAHRDRTFKRALYARHGVREFWFVDTDAHTIEVLLLGAHGYETVGIFGAGQTLTSPTLTGFNLNTDEVF